MKSQSKDKCPNCGSSNLGEYLCRDCFENLLPFDGGWGTKLWMDEFGELYPLVGRFNRAVSDHEKQEIMDELESTNYWSEYQEARVEHMTSKIRELTNELSEAHLSNIRETGGYYPGANIWGLIYTAVVTINSVVWMCITGLFGGLIALIASLWLYKKLFVFCRACKKFNFKPHTLMRTDLIDQRYGTHTRYVSVQSTSQHYDSRGKMAGYSDSTTQIPVSQDHVDETHEFTRACTYCGHVWSHRKTRRYNIG